MLHSLAIAIYGRSLGEDIKNCSPVAVVISIEESRRFEELKMEFVKSRFENIDGNDLMDGNAFLDEPVS